MAMEILEALRGELPDGEAMLKMWQQAKKLPGGKALFSKAVARMAPYTATIDARVIHLERGFARLEMDDRKAVRNHLDSIHAVALMNLAEETGGLALLSTLPPRTRGIVTALRIEFLKKARGTLSAESTVTLGDVTEDIEYTVQIDVRDGAGDLVARAEADWRLGPKP